LAEGESVDLFVECKLYLKYKRTYFTFVHWVIQIEQTGAAEQKMRNLFQQRWHS